MLILKEQRGLFVTHPHQNISWLPIYQTGCRSFAVLDTLTYDPEHRVVSSYSYSSLGIEKENQENTKPKGPRLANILKSLGLRLIYIEYEIVNSINKTYKDLFIADGESIKENLLKSISPTHVIQFLKTDPRKHIDGCTIYGQTISIKQSEIKTTQNAKLVLDYCLKDSKALFDNLLDVPLMITNDGVLSSFSDDKSVFVS